LESTNVNKHTSTPAHQHSRPRGRKVELPLKKKGCQIREWALRDCRGEGQGRDESFKTGRGSGAS